MSEIEGHAVVQKNSLTKTELGKVERLKAQCNRHEGLDLYLYLDPADAPNHFLYYAGEELIGAATIQDGKEPEIYGMVHPNHRLRGVGRLLLDAVKAECQKRGYDNLLLVGEEASVSGKSFAAAIGAKHRFSEHGMVLNPAAIDRGRPRPTSLQLRSADTGDLETIAKIKSVSFGKPENEALQETVQMHQATDRVYYIGWLGDEAVGILRVGRYRDSADITAFAVLPEHRGRGYGRGMLLDSVDLLLAEGWGRITIDVETENDNALGLYLSCGFEVVKTYNFYDLAF